MVESVGKKLQEARVTQGVTIEDASRATKIRPDRLMDLERDDLTNFPNLAYARGFLLIYAKFLSVDVADFASALESSQAGVDDYEYLSHKPVTTRARIIRHTPRRPVLPWIIAAAVVVLGGFAWSFMMNFKRLGDLDHLSTSGKTVAPKEEAAPIPTARPALVAPVSTPTPPALSPEALTTSSSTDRLLGAVPTTPPEATIPITDPTGPDPNEVVLQPIRKTWVKIQRGARDSAPIFEDFLYPNTRPLTLHGGNYWIEVTDASAVEIRKNGTVIAYQAPGLSIQ